LPYLCVMNVTTKTSTLTKREFESLNNRLIRSCEAFMGKKKGINVKLRNRGKSYRGLYDYETKTIYLYINNLPLVSDYIKVFIHEYAHSRQRGLKTKYGAYNILYGYKNNPYEIDANTKMNDLYPVVKTMVKKMSLYES